MVREKDERLAVAEAKARFLAQAEAATVANYVRANPAEALFTALAAGLALGARGERFGNFLKMAGLASKLVGRKC